MAQHRADLAGGWPADTAQVYREVADEDRRWAEAMSGVSWQTYRMTPIDPEPLLSRLHTDLGLKRLNPWWAKLEIALGLTATGAGVLVMTAGTDAAFVVGGLVLFVLGGYLALAGHRSHLYQSNNLLAAYMAGEIRKHHPKG